MCEKYTNRLYDVKPNYNSPRPSGEVPSECEAERGREVKREPPSQSADADSSPIGGAEVLAFPRCGEGGRRSRSDEGYPTGDYSRYVIAMRLFFTLISHPRLRSDDSFPTAGEAKG